MANSNEIFSKFFDENEKTKVDQKIEDLGLKEKIDSLKIVDQKLNSLKARTVRTPENFEDRFNAYKDAILKLEEEKGLAEKVKTKASELKTQTTQEVKDSAIKKGKEVLEETGFSGVVEEVKSFSDKITGLIDKFKSFGKYIGAALAPILGYFGIKNLPSWLGGGSEEGVGENANNSASSEQVSENTPSEVKPKVEEKPSSVDSNEVIGIKEKLRYNLGFSLLRTLSGEKVDKEKGYGNIRKNLGQKTYEDFLKNKRDESFKNEILGEEEILSEQYDKISISYSSQKVQDLLRIGLKPEMVKAILTGVKGDKDNESLKNDSNFRFTKILEMLDSSSFHYKKLTIYELTILYTYTIPALTSISFFKSFDGVKDGISKMFGGINLENFKELENQSLDSNMLSRIITRSVGQYRNPEMSKSKEDVIADFGIQDSEMADFEKLYQFKEDFYKLLNNSEKLKKLNINEERREAIRERIDYRGIIALYEVMGGEVNLDKINPINIPIIGFILSKVIGITGKAMDVFDASSYMASLGKQILFDSNTNIFTADERLVMGIYRDSFIDLYINSRINDIMGVAGLFTDKGSLKNAAIIAGAGGFTLNVIASNNIKKAIEKGKLPFFSRYLKILGWAGMLSGVALGGLSLVTSTGENFGGEFSTLKQAYENKNLTKIKEFLDEFEESVLKYEKGEEEVRVVSYNKEAPYVLYNGKVYQIGLMSDDIIGKISGGFINIDPKGKEITVEDGIINVKIDNNDYEIGIEELVKSDWKLEKKASIDSSFWNKIKVLGTDLLRETNTGYMVGDGGKREDIFNLGKVGDFNLYLLPIGDLVEEA